MKPYYLGKSRTIELTFTDWDVNDIIVELARYIDGGFKITSYNCNFSMCEHNTVNVYLIGT